VLSRASTYSLTHSSSTVLVATTQGDNRFARSSFAKLPPRKKVAIWAEKEFKNLTRMHRAGLPCPRPMHLAQHVLVMELVTGAEEGVPAPQLRELGQGGAKLSARQLRGLLAQALCIAKRLYRDCALVHGDLSEYNLLVDARRAVWVIDVGQAVDASHPEARELLARDLRTVLAWFRAKGMPLGRNGRAGVDDGEIVALALQFVLGEEDAESESSDGAGSDDDDEDDDFVKVDGGAEAFVVVTGDGAEDETVAATEAESKAMGAGSPAMSLLEEGIDKNESGKLEALDFIEHLLLLSAGDIATPATGMAAAAAASAAAAAGES